MTAYRFVHAADIHLDSPLKSLALRDLALAELIGNATRQAFVRVVDLCLDERVDALLLAGDLYDGEQTSMKTARFLSEQVRRLHEAGVRIYIIRGNHDALSRITKELVFPDTVTLFGGRAEAIAVERAASDFPVSIHGLSFAQPHAPDSLLSRYKPPAAGAVNIGLLHTSLGGAPGHDRYSPCSLGDLQATGYRYWALGHIHKRSVVEGDCAVVMPGMPQGRDINEAGPKSVTLVTIADDLSIQVEERRTSLAEFDRVTVDISGIEDWRDLANAVGRTLEGARARVMSEHLVARVQIIGSTPLAWRIRREVDLLKTEADDRASAIGATWVEKVEIDCRPPEALGPTGSDPLAELRRLIGDEVMASDAFRAEIVGIAEELRGQLPSECRGMLGADDASFDSIVSALATEGADDVMARLHAEADEAT